MHENKSLFCHCIHFSLLLFGSECQRMVCLIECAFAASSSPHVKSGVLVGSLRSMWRAMTSPAFDFQGDPLQQGGALIVGPGHTLSDSAFISISSLDLNILCFILQLHWFILPILT